MFVYRFYFFMLVYLIIANTMSVACHMQETVRIPFKFADSDEVRSFKVARDIIRMLKVIDGVIEDLLGDKKRIEDPIPLNVRAVQFESIINILTTAKSKLSLDEMSKRKTIFKTYEMGHIDILELTNTIEEVMSWMLKSSEDLLDIIESADYLEAKTIMRAGTKLWVKQYSATANRFNGLNNDIKAVIIEQLTPPVFLAMMRANESKPLSIEQIPEQEGSFRVALSVHNDIREPPKGITAKAYYEELNRFSKFVSIPGGTYEIGSPTTEAHRYPDEIRHSITLSPFFIMEAAVTQEDYAMKTGTNPSLFKEEKYCPESFKVIEVNGVKIPVCSDHPVVNVSWHNADAFARLLTMMDSKYTYSLPTEAQLEVAFRGGTTTTYVSGNDIAYLGDYVWLIDNSNMQTHPVKSKQANALGFHRSSVWEWAVDYFEKNYSGSIGLDPKGPLSGISRVTRGGSWYQTAKLYRSAYRGCYAPDYHSRDLGFRLVKTPCHL